MPDDSAQIFVLRLFRDDGSPAGWHISLYRASSGERLHFTSPTALLRHLERLLCQVPPPSRPPKRRPEEKP